MKVSVTKECITHGIARNVWECPVAIAVRRATQARAVYVQGGRILWGTLGAEMPFEVKKFIRRFDECKPVEPFEFELLAEEQKQ